MVNRHLNPRWSSEEPYAHVHGELRAKVATMSLNRGHKHNLLTPTMIKEVQRFFKSYDLDDMIDLVWCQSSNADVFSQGTDLKYLLQRVKQNKNQEAVNYLAQVQNCAMTFATYNKATLTYIRGDVSGSAAAMVGTSAFGLTDDSVKWWMNETKYGFVPHGGASYIFSRMPRELGTYLALTGDHLNQEDLITLGLAKYRLDTSQQDLVEDLSEVMLDHSRPGHTNELYGNMFQEFRQKRAQGYDQYVDKVDHEIQQRIFNVDPDLAEDPRMVMAEVLYRNQNIKKANLDFDLQNKKSTEKTQRIQNYMQNFDEKIFGSLKTLGHLSVPKTLRISCEHPAISRCFSADSLEEIQDRLRAENCEWANNVLQNLSTRSPLSLKLTLKLIREAEKSTWIKCLESEYNVMTKLIQRSDFSVGVQRLSDSQGKDIWSKQNISKDEVQSFFEEQHLKHGVVENSLHPVKDFYLKYPDNVRLFLNEETQYGDLRARAGQEVDIIAFLKNNNFPTEDDTIAVSSIRQIIMNAEEQSRMTYQKVSKLFELCGSVENLKKYHEMRLNYIDSQFSVHSDSINQSIEAAIDKVFQSKFDERMDAYGHIASVKLHKDKSDMFSSVRNTILNKRLTTSNTDLMSPNTWKGTDRMLFFPNDDTVSFLDTYNDSLEDSTLFKRLYAKHTNTEFKYGKKEPLHPRYLLGEFSTAKNDPFDRKSKEYNQLYGDPLQEFNLDEYHNQLMRMGGKSKLINEFIKKQGTEKVKEMLKDNKKITEESLATQMEKNIEFHKNLDQQKQQDLNRNRTQTINEVQEILTANSFDKMLEKLTQLDEPTDYKLQVGQLRPKLHQLINSEESLREIISPLFDKSIPEAFQKLQKKYDQLLTSIYQGKIRSFLEHNKIIEFDGMVSLVDNLLGHEIEKDLNKLLEPHVFFTFAYLLLKDMSTYYEIFQDINIPKSSESYKAKLVSIINTKTGLTLQEDELNKFFIYIDELTHIAITLFVVYRDQIHFTSDIALLQLIQLQQKRAAEENLANPRIKSFFQVVTEQAAKSQKGWQKSTMMHYIENQQSGFNPYLSSKETIQIQKDIRRFPNVFDYQTDVYERRALRLARNIKPLLLKEFIPGMQHYLMQIDLNAAKASRKDQLITPKYIEDALQQLEQINEIKVITQNHSLSQWFQDKIDTCVQELFNYRRTQEIKLTSEQLVKFDMEFSKLLEPSNFKATLIQSFDREMDQLGEVAKHVHITQNKERDQLFEQYKASTKQNIPDHTLPLLMTAMAVPLYFDPKKAHFQTIPSKALTDLEFQEQSPFKKGRKIKERGTALHKDDMNARAIKLKQDLIGKLDPVLEGLYEQDVMSDEIHDNLKYVYDRIQLKKQAQRLGNRN